MTLVPKDLTKNEGIEAVLFDLDGTLLDTAQDFTVALNILRAEENLGALTHEMVRPQVSHGANALVKLSFGELPPDEHESLRKRLLDIYRRALSHHTCLFTGGEEMLRDIERRGLAWGVVTNKPGWLTAPIMDDLKLAPRARAVVSGDTLAERKPHPLPLLHAAGIMKVDPRACVYVGDAERDMQAAEAAGMYALVAGYGYLGVDDRARDWYSHGWLNEPLELLNWLDAPRPARAVAGAA
jgi:2-phosphoglycolate phosphatase